MKTNLYCIVDTKANRCTEPFSCPTDSVAKRNFIFGCLASQTPPQDSILFRVGSFSSDEDSASSFVLSSCSSPVVVQPTVEEIEGYSKIFAMMNPDVDSDSSFDEFSAKGVI